MSSTLIKYSTVELSHFKLYFEYVFNFLADGNCGLEPITFINYLNYNFFISERIFKSLLLSSSISSPSNMWNCQDFIEGMCTLFQGRFNVIEQVNWLFVLWNFSNDFCKITYEDTKIFITHLLHATDISFNSETLEEIWIVFFNGEQVMTKEVFYSTTLKVNSDIYYLVFYFLNNCKPSRDEEINYLCMVKQNISECSAKKNSSSKRRSLNCNWYSKGKWFLEKKDLWNWVKPTSVLKEFIKASCQESKSLKKNKNNNNNKTKDSIIKENLRNIRYTTASTNFSNNPNDDDQKQLKFIKNLEKKESLDTVLIDKTEMDDWAELNNFETSIKECTKQWEQCEFIIQNKIYSFKNWKKSDSSLSKNKNQQQLKSPEITNKTPEIISPKCRKYKENSLFNNDSKRSLMVRHQSIPTQDIKKSRAVNNSTTITQTQNEHTFNFAFIIDNSLKKYNMDILDNTIYISPYENNCITFKQILIIKNIVAEYDNTKEIPDCDLWYGVRISTSISSTKRVSIFYFYSDEDANTFVMIINSKSNFKDKESNYNILEKIGHGSFGVVFKVEDKYTNEVYSMKKIAKDYQDSEALEIVKSEIDIMTFLIKTPFKGIIQTFEVFETIDNAYIIEEYIENGVFENFYKKIQGGQSPANNNKNFLKNYNEENKECKGYVNNSECSNSCRISPKLNSRLNCFLHKIFTQISETLQFLDLYGIIHRDLKWDNIWIVHDEKYSFDSIQIKWIDFGLSHITGATEWLTQQYGTLLYLPPEIIKAIPYNKSVDIWALGWIGFSLLFRFQPFMSINSNIIIKKILTMNIYLPDCKNVKDPNAKKIEEVIKVCLEKDHNKRSKIKNILQMLK